MKRRINAVEAGFWICCGITLMNRIPNKEIRTRIDVKSTLTGNVVLRFFTVRDRLQSFKNTTDSCRRELHEKKDFENHFLFVRTMALLHNTDILLHFHV